MIAKKRIGDYTDTEGVDDFVRRVCEMMDSGNKFGW